MIFVHTRNITSTAFHQPRNISKICCCLLKQLSMPLSPAYYTTVTAFFTGLCVKAIQGFKLFQNTCILTRTNIYITPVLKQLHWLPVCYRKDFSSGLYSTDLAPEYIYIGHDEDNLFLQISRVHSKSQIILLKYCTCFRNKLKLIFLVSLLIRHMCMLSIRFIAL